MQLISPVMVIADVELIAIENVCAARGEVINYSRSIWQRNVCQQCTRLRGNAVCRDEIAGERVLIFRRLMSDYHLLLSGLELFSLATETLIALPSTSLLFNSLMALLA